MAHFPKATGSAAEGPSDDLGIGIEWAEDNLGRSIFPLSSLAEE